MKRSAIFLITLFFGLFNTTAQAQLTWERTYGEGLYNSCQGALETRDAHYVLLQNQSSISGNTQLILTCIDSLGIISWEKNIGTSSLYWGNDIKQCADKGFIITGNVYTTTEKSYDLLLIKTDSAGNIEWEREVGGAGWDFGQSVLIAPDSAYLAIGKTYSYGAGDADVYVVKMNFAGDTLWTRTFGGDSLDYGASGDIAPDSNYLIAANTRSFGHGNLDAWILKINTAGDTLWTACYGDTLEDCVNSFRTTPDKGFVFVGYTFSYGAQNSEYWLMRFDSSNNYLWKLPEYWNITTGDDRATHISLNDSSRYVISGYTTSWGNGGREMFMMIMGDYNNFKHSNTFGSLEDEEAAMAFQTSDKGYLIAGYTAGLGPSNTNVLLIKTDSTIASGGNCNFTTGIVSHQAPSAMEISIYPNPAKDLINLRFNPAEIKGELLINVYDVSGRLLSGPINADSREAGLSQINLQSLNPGLYFLEIHCVGETWTATVILQK